MIAYAGHSQSSSDTVCMPIGDALKVLAAGKEGRLLQQKVVLLQKDTQTLQQSIFILNKRISEKEGMITDLEAKDVNNEGIIKALREEIEAYKTQLKLNEKALKKQRRKTLLASVGGIGAVAAIFLLLNK